MGSLILALYNGGFGVTLLADPEKFYGRAFGAMLTGVAAMHFLDGPSASLCKQSAIASALLLIPMVMALNDPDNFIPMMFKAQVLIHAAYIYIVGSAGGL